MNDPVELKRKVRQWFDHAGDDLEEARQSITVKRGGRWWIYAFHAQQAAEKYLKGYLLAHLVDFPPTHNIRHLLELCARISIWPSRVSKAETLSAFSVTTRYPGETEIVTRREAVRAVRLAEQVRDAVETALKSEGLFSKTARR